MQPLSTANALRFFFYGTLLDGAGNAVARAVHARLRDLGPATVPGALHAIPDPEGWYPALLPGDGLVRGRLYETLPAFASEDLAALDAWEEFDPARPEVSPYRRVAVAVEGGGSAQAYRYSRPLPSGACAIPDGDFPAWLSREGVKAFGEPAS